MLGKDLWYSRELGQFKIRIGKDCKKALEMKNPSSKNTAFIFSIWHCDFRARCYWNDEG